jgi:hypothetical protein
LSGNDCGSFWDYRGLSEKTPKSLKQNVFYLYQERQLSLALFSFGGVADGMPPALPN